MDVNNPQNVQNTHSVDSSQLHELFRENPLAWGYYFFPHHFNQESPPFHLKILKTIMNNQKVAICAPRGSAKSSIAFLYIMHSIVFNRFYHGILLQASLDKAISSLSTIQNEFKSNDLLRATYNIKLPMSSQDGVIFRSPNGFETFFKAFGREQMGKIRGSKFGSKRPDIVLADDLEDDEMVRSRELRDELHRRWKDAVEPAIDISANYRIIYIDTMKHYDSQLAKMLNPESYADYKKLSFPALFINSRGERESLWPSRMTLGYLLKLEREDPITFAKEYMGDPISGTSSNFNASDFRRWSTVNNDYILFDSDGSISSRGELSDCKAAIGYDLAWDESRRHDCTAIVPCLMTPTGEILIDNYVNQRGLRPDLLCEYLFNFDEKYISMTKKTVIHAFEKGKYEKVFKWLLDKEKKKKNKYPITIDVPWITDKKERIIIPLQPRYINHAIFHRKDMGELESQLTRFPAGTHDDIVDALQLSVRSLNDVPIAADKKPLTQDEKFKRLRAAFSPTINKPSKLFGSLMNKRISIQATKSFTMNELFQ